MHFSLNKSFKSHDGSEIHYAKMGRNKKGVVIFYHGLMNVREWMYPFCLPFLKDYLFIVPDIRGHGDSQNLAGYSDRLVEIACDDIDCLIKHEKLQNEKLVMISYSLSTIMSMKYFDKYSGANFKKYIHIDLSPEINGPTPKERLVVDDYDLLYRSVEQIYDFLQEHPKRTRLSQFSEQQQKFYNDIQKVVFNRALFSMRKKMIFDFVRNIATWLVLTLGKTDRNFRDFINFPRSTMHNNNDFSKVQDRLGDCKAVVLMGKRGEFFDQEFHESVIHRLLPKAVVYRFYKSGHELMFLEPLKFIRILKKELR